MHSAQRGARQRRQISKAGSKMLRWALTEAVQSLCRVDGPYRNLCKRLERKKKDKGTSATACARKLLRAIWCMLTESQARTGNSGSSPRASWLQHVESASQVATIQELASRGMQMPVPTRLLASSRRQLTDTLPKGGLLSRLWRGLRG